MLPTISVNRPASSVKQIDYAACSKALVDRLPHSSCEVCVIIPVRDEAENLPATLLALSNQIELNGKPLDKKRYEIIVLANNCSDESASIARCFAQTQPEVVIHVIEITIESDRAHIGWVRKLLMDEACRRFRAIGRNFGVIASTDGDTRVSSTWIAATLAEIDRGADAVGGRIITCSKSRALLNRATKLYYLRYQRYGYLISQLEAGLDPYFESSPRHHHHYGASLAVTAYMYAKVGGLPPLPSSEDVALYDALMRFDARFCHSPRVRVITSARSVGRAEAGLSDRLSQLNAMTQKQESIFVEPAALIATRFYLRRWLRYLWQNRLRGFPHELSLIAQKLDLTKELLQEIILRSSTFGLLVEQIGRSLQNRDWLARRWQKVSIQQAITDMSTMIEKNYYPQLTLNALEQIQPIPLLAQPF
jgi:hypothetical protein